MAAISLSAFLITIIWRQWSVATIVTLRPVQTHLKYMPFPAITICNTNSLKRSHIAKFAPDSIERSMVRDICDSDESLPNTTTTWTQMRQFVKNV